MYDIAQSGEAASAEVNSKASRRAAALDIHQAVNRGMNVSVAALVLLFFLPIMILVAVAIWCQDRGPIFFAHRRIGRDGRKFPCLKFRSMAIDAQERLQELLDADPQARAEWERDHKLRDDPRVTPLGVFLRKSSLDELPQLLNVLRGEMDLVGPRPIVDGEVCKYGPRFKHYCAVNPGITGLWQVSGRNDTSYRSRVAMDCVYAKSKSLPLDLWILVVTVPAVLLRKGSY
jgi:lipopolysaccharide/colanic/teichoic acid biosynthesis glycosyltransferase